jgi:para-nitrobenzyl esterase
MSFATRIALAMLTAEIICSAIVVPTIASNSTNSAIVTESGPLKGTTVGSVNEYLGIPYAAPPVDALRWQPPQPFGQWQGVFHAIQFGNVCPQFDSSIGSVVGKEDCLFLNVYTPQPSKSPQGDNHSGLPVMVWIHGGGLTSGTGETYDPTPMVEQGNVIVVTINYRLGLLGFFAQTALDSESSPSANYGLMDQQSALAWVRRNISAFGGDRDRVTIFGESAGGQSVYANLASPTAAGLFQRAIAESGSYASFTDYLNAIIPIAQAETVGSIYEPSGEAFATAVGCSSQTAACLHTVTPETLVSVQTFPMYPVIDGLVLTSTLGTAFSTGNFNRMPVISGTNHDEYRLFVALDYDYVGHPLSNAEYPVAVDALWGPLGPVVLEVYPLPASPPADAASLALGASGTDGLFSCPARLADESLSRYVTTYTYEFNDGNAPLEDGLVPASFPLGAYHSAEIQYLMVAFGMPAPFTHDQQQLSDAMISYWTQFAATGDPNSPSEPLWSAYNSATDEFQSLVPPKPVVESTFATDHNCTTLWDLL